MSAAPAVVANATATAEIPMSSDFMETPIKDSSNVNATRCHQQPSFGCSWFATAAGSARLVLDGVLSRAIRSGLSSRMRHVAVRIKLYRRLLGF